MRCSPQKQCLRSLAQEVDAILHWARSTYLREAILTSRCQGVAGAYRSDLRYGRHRRLLVIVAHKNGRE
jgi:hypothetical protein